MTTKAKQASLCNSSSIRLLILLHIKIAGNLNQMPCQKQQGIIFILRMVVGAPWCEHILTLTPQRPAISFSRVRKSRVFPSLKTGILRSKSSFKEANHETRENKKAGIDDPFSDSTDTDAANRAACNRSVQQGHTGRDDFRPSGSRHRRSHHQHH